MRTITAMFDERDDAEEAKADLIAAGVDAGNVSVLDQSHVGGTGTPTTVGYSSTTDTTSEPGIWGTIKSWFSDDADTYEEGLRRGGYLLTARVDEAMADRAIDILDDEGVVDTDARADTWRSEGWTGGRTAMTGDRSGLSGDRSDMSGERVASNGDMTIPIVQEELQVGKREVLRGGVRVRSYVVEDAAHADVNLREEHVHVERRPVTSDRAIDGDGGDLLRERSFEVTETAEEAVVSKSAHVREEVVVGKTVDERIERVDDTVRRTEVDIEDIDGGTRRNDGLTGTDRTTTDRY